MIFQANQLFLRPSLILSNTRQSEVHESIGSTEIGLNDGLSTRITLAGKIKPTFIIGPPRSGTTLLAKNLARGHGVLSLSEPFFARRILRPRVSRMMFQVLRAYFHWPARVPATSCPVQLFNFLRDCALDKGHTRLIIKELYGDFDFPRPLSNLETTNAIIASGAPIIAIVRDPYDTVASTLKMVKRYLSGCTRRVFWLACDSVPRFKDDEDIVRHAARNWSRFAERVRKDQLPLVRYEALIRAPAEQIRRVCEAVGLPFDEKLLNKNYRPSAFGGLGDPSVKLWPSKSYHGRSVGRGRSLPPALRAVVRLICGQTAAELGYAA